MKIEEINQSKLPIIAFDKKLEKLRGKVLFPKKLKKANEILAKSGLPENDKKSIEKGLEDADSGKLDPHSNARKLYEKWL